MSIYPLPTPIPIDELVTMVSSSQTIGRLQLPDGTVKRASSHLTTADMVGVAKIIQTTFNQYQKHELVQLQTAINRSLQQISQKTNSRFKRLVLRLKRKYRSTLELKNLFIFLTEQLSYVPHMEQWSQIFHDLPGPGGISSAPSPSAPSPCWTTRSSFCISSPTRRSSMRSLPGIPSPLSPSGPSLQSLSLHPSFPTFDPSSTLSTLNRMNSHASSIPPPPPCPPQIDLNPQPSKFHRDFEEFSHHLRLPEEPPIPLVPEGYDLGKLRTTDFYQSPLQALDRLDDSQRTDLARQLERYVIGLELAIQSMEEFNEVRRLQLLPEEIRSTTERLVSELERLQEVRRAYEQTHHLSQSLAVDEAIVMKYHTTKGEIRTWRVVHENHPIFKPIFVLYQRYIEAKREKTELLTEAQSKGISIKDLHPPKMTKKIEGLLDPKDLKNWNFGCAKTSQLNDPKMRQATQRLLTAGITLEEIDSWIAHQQALKQAKEMGLSLSILETERELHTQLDRLSTAIGINIETILNHSIERKLDFHAQEVKESEISYNNLRATLQQKIKEQTAFSESLYHDHPFQDWVSLLPSKKKWAKDLKIKSNQIKNIQTSPPKEPQELSKRNSAKQLLAADYSSTTLTAVEALMCSERGSECCLGRERFATTGPLPGCLSIDSEFK